MEYNNVLPADFIIPTSAFWLEGDLLRKNPFERVTIEPGDVVMDCGGYIGTFSAAALEQSAGHVTAYEASPKNAALLRENMARYGEKAKVVEGALTAGHDATIRLTMAGFDGANTILPSTKHAKFVDVKALNFRDALLSLKPHVVKLDLEGAEYDLLDSLRPGDLDGVRCMFIEFHPIDAKAKRIEAIWHFLKAEGYEMLSANLRAFTVSR